MRRHRPQDRRQRLPISRKSNKDDIRYLGQEELEKTYDKLRKTPLATFRYKEGGPAAPHHLGFMIEDIEPSPSVDPERNMVDLYGYTSMAVAAVQVQARQIEALQKEVDDLRRSLKQARKGRR